MENTILWKPDRTIITNLDHFRDLINQKYHLTLDNYEDLREWSIMEISHFWAEIWKFTNIKHSQDYNEVIDEKRLINEIPEWFSGARLNYAENILRDRSESEGCIETKTFSQLHDRISTFVSSLKKIGIGKGDVVAGYMPNCSETVEAMLATAAIGGVWTCASTDFGVKGVLDRFTQVRPKVLFSCDFVVYNGKIYPLIEKLKEIVSSLPDLKAVVVMNYKKTESDVVFKDIPTSINLKDFLKMGENCDNSSIEFAQVTFSHPLFVMYSSGTTGTPKCMVHSVGGTLIKHLEEHVIQGNVKAEDVMLYFTSTGWMLWNWLISTLAIGTAIVLYDGSPLVPDLNTVWNLISELNVTILGTGAKWISIMESKQLEPSGTDIIGCFAGINVTLPVHRGEIQCRFLGMAVESWDEEVGKSVLDESGELVCVKPFPSMPVRFWNDKDGSKGLRNDNVWCHGDFCRINSTTGGIIMLGRSDGTLNPSGIRFGSSEVYNIIEKMAEIEDSLCVAQTNSTGDERVILFLKMASGFEFNKDLVGRISGLIRNELSPRHVPAVILEICDIPYTTSGKKVEVAVKLIISGRDVVARAALRNPSSLDLFYGLRRQACDAAANVNCNCCFPPLDGCTQTSLQRLGHWKTWIGGFVTTRFVLFEFAAIVSASPMTTEQEIFSPIVFGEQTHRSIFNYKLSSSNMKNIHNPHSNE
uniref:Acetoacetyl-CoA synthetase n=1 Tax=Strigamia maritima TaxID=126957 RepID=T1ILV2_STRMM